ncbi:hypothetical protein [Chondromyces crocatus]|uniref:hypothetical protein n=1 Tax=Chondromyces crocatus TaxID=52 RepID=UPI001C54D032|nr:hypothetical protein [Chondromyces crocatus]
MEQSITLGNLDSTAWLADFTIKLPPGFKALNKEEPTSDLRLDEIHQVGIALRGTVAPGRHDLSFRYNVPLDKNERQALVIETPPRLAQARVIAEASKNMGLEVTGFPAAQRTQLQNGMKVLFTEQRAQRQSGGLKALTIALTGLPTPPFGRWIAIGLAAVAVLGALGVFLRKEDGPAALDPRTRQDLLDARDALLNEFVELERARNREDIGPKAYSRVRSALLEALTRIVSMAEGIDPTLPATGEPASKLETDTRRNRSSRRENLRGRSSTSDSA